VVPGRRAPGLNGTTWPVTSKSNIMRRPARCCLTEVGDISEGEPLDIGGHVHRLNALEIDYPCPSHQRRDFPAAREYAARVFPLRMLVKNSRERRAARSPAQSMST
jgi:hypothetical protein